jgi:lauroyl/myristoyl acyltransferase
MDGAREFALFGLLDSMTCYDTPFDYGGRVEREDLVTRAMRQGRGVLLVTAHGTLSLLVTRFLFDRGIPSLIVTAGPGLRIAGTSITADTVTPSATFMLRIRSWWRRGGLVGAMVDGPGTREAVTYQTAAGPAHLSLPLLNLATRCGVPVVFLASRADDDCGVVITFGAPSAEACGDAREIVRELAVFLAEHVDRVTARARRPVAPWTRAVEDQTGDPAQAGVRRERPSR